MEFYSLCNRLDDFPVTIRSCFMDVYVNKLLLGAARLLEFFAWKVFSLMYDLNSFKSKVIKSLFKSKLSFFYRLFLMNFSVCFLYLFFFLPQ